MLPVYLQISLATQTAGSFVQMWMEKIASVLGFITSVHEWDKELGIQSILSPIPVMESWDEALSSAETKHYSELLTSGY